MTSAETLNYQNRYERPQNSIISGFMNRIKGLVGGVLGGAAIGVAAGALTGLIGDLFIPGISVASFLTSGLAFGGIIGGFEGASRRR
jgi:hypothetical protein